MVEIQCAAPVKTPDAGALTGQGGKWYGSQGLSWKASGKHADHQEFEAWQYNLGWRGIRTNMVEVVEALGEHKFLTEVTAKELLSAEGIPTVPTRLARSPGEALRLARALGLPVALKVVSAQIIHKSDIGGVRLHLTSLSQVSKAYKDILATVQSRVPAALIDGVSVQPMAKPGVEVVLGLTRDRTFGPVIMFGLGGIFVEMLNDVAFRVVPLRMRDARAMLRDIRAFPTLQGSRGIPPTDLSALEDMLLKLSAVAERHPEIDAIDLNPVIAYPTGALAVDARILLS
jgi:acyl-CoA synthetase (NDP forming)